MSFGFVSFGCGESDSPTAPSATTTAEAPSYRYNAGLFPGWTTEQERRASALHYAGFLAPLVCEADGGIYRQGSVEIFSAVNPTRLPGAVDGWEYTENRAITGFNFGARPAYTWRATCDEPPPR